MNHSKEQEFKLYQYMWDYVQTFPLAEFIVEQNFKNWFDQMVDVGRFNDIEFCVNYAKKFSGTKTYALLSEFENMKAWNINEQSIFSNARDVFENMFFVDTPEPINGDLLRGTRNEAFAREEYMSYLADLYPADDGFTIVQRVDLVQRLSTFNSIHYPWFGGTPDDIIEIKHKDAPQSRFIMPDYKCPKPSNITPNLDPEYRHQLCHYDLGCDLLNAEDPTFPTIDKLELVKFNVETQSILVIDAPKDPIYKARMTEACDMWWHEYALKGIIPPLQNDFTDIITAADFADIQTKATDAIRLRDPDFKIDAVIEERINSIPTMLYDYSVAKKLVNEMGKIAATIQDELQRSFDMLHHSGVLGKEGEFTLGCGSIKWKQKRIIDKEGLILIASNIGIDLSHFCKKTVSFDVYKAIDQIHTISSNLGKGVVVPDDTPIEQLFKLCDELKIPMNELYSVEVEVNHEDLLKAIEYHIREHNLDVDLSHLFSYVDNTSIALSRKTTGTVASLGSSITADAAEILSKVIASKQGFSSDLIVEQQKEFTDRLAYQSRSKRFAEHVLSILDNKQKYHRSPIPRAKNSHSSDYAFVTFSGDIIECDTGELIGNLKTLGQHNEPHLTATHSIETHADTPSKLEKSDHQKIGPEEGQLRERNNTGRVIANVVIKSRNIVAEARGRALVEFEQKIERINTTFGDASIQTASTIYRSDVSNLLGDDFDFANEMKKRSR